MHSISDTFKDLDASMTGETVSIDDLLNAVHERGFGLLLLILSIPMALPIPVPPGINVLLASPLILLTAQQAIGRHTVWLPTWMRKKTIKRKKMSAMIQTILPWTARIEKLIKPRLEFVTLGLFSHLIGVFGLIMALTICVPLPLTNTVPSLGIALMAVGVITRDGLAVLAGAMIGMLWVVALSMIVIFLGAEGIDFVKDTIKAYL
ncbi:MAG: hypothetical protein COA45_09425 [Zetaproteobacteria bacterium]|nr:MAG: hypothetical protein COA45_09425 [Zetaproteobacteria bacterium]